MGEYMGRTLKSFLVCFSLPSNLIKMKSMLMVALFVAVAAAYPHELDAEYKEPIAITKYGSEFNEFGKYSYNFEGANGIKMSEEGEQNASVTSPKKLVALPVDLTLTNWTESPTPSTGLLMRTDSSPLVLTCPLLPPCPSTSSRCWLT